MTRQVTDERGRGVHSHLLSAARTNWTAVPPTSPGRRRQDRIFLGFFGEGNVGKNPTLYSSKSGGPIVEPSGVTEVVVDQMGFPGAILSISEEGPETDRADWLHQFHRGQRRALEECYRAHFADVSTAVGRVLSGADKETVIHEVFFR